jgi:hypothetical protein
MAEYKHQQQDLQACLQHLANRRQEEQYQRALVIVQGLERQRLSQTHQQAVLEAALEAHLQRQQ